MIRTLDLFSGIGGISLGLHWAGGFSTAAFVEIEPFCRSVLAKNFPGVPIMEDVCNVTEDTIRGLGRIDMVAGGFPCQDISCAGKGVGLEGERSGLWFEMLRVIRIVRPRWLLIENVPALRTRGADVVLEGLEEASYSAWPLVVGARHVGAPHKRDRVWIVGLRNETDTERRNRSDGFRRGLSRCVEMEIALGDERLCDSQTEEQNDSSSPSDRGGEARRGSRPHQPESLGLPGIESEDRDSFDELPESRKSEGDSLQVGEVESVGSEDQVARVIRDGGSGKGSLSQGKERGLRTGVLAEPNSPRPQEHAGEPGDARTQFAAALGSRWPARPGEPQHEWEAPRLAYSDRARELQPQGIVTGERGRIGDGGEGGAQSGLGLPVARLSRRMARLAGRRRREQLKALGNSVVPQVVAAIGRAIMRVDEQMEGQS